jgi:hypothetical protein
MTTGRSTAMSLLGAIVAAALLMGAAATASAQTIAKPDKKPAAARSAQRAPAPATAAEQGTDYWAINTDVGKYRDDRPVPAPSAPGRVPLQNAPGSVGFTSAPVRTGQFADGRTTPGLDRYNQDPQSYVGLSLSVTSSNKSFPIPAPLQPSQW